jgi:hypothetical protein
MLKGGQWLYNSYMRMVFINRALMGGRLTSANTILGIIKNIKLNLVILTFIVVNLVYFGEAQSSPTCDDFPNLEKMDTFTEANEEGALNFNYEFQVKSGPEGFCRLVRARSWPGGESTNITLIIGDERLFPPSFLPRCSSSKQECPWASFHVMRVTNGEIVPSQFKLKYGGSNADIYESDYSEMTTNIKPLEGTAIETQLKYYFEDNDQVYIMNTKTISLFVKNLQNSPTPLPQDKQSIIMQNIESIVTDIDGKVIPEMTTQVTNGFLSGLNYERLSALNNLLEDNLTFSDQIPNNFFSSLVVTPEELARELLARSWESSAIYLSEGWEDDGWSLASKSDQYPTAFWMIQAVKDSITYLESTTVNYKPNESIAIWQYYEGLQ